MNTLPPGLRGLLAQRQMAQQEQQGQLGQIQGLLGIQQAQMQQGLLSQQMQDRQRTQLNMDAFAQTLSPEERPLFLANPGAFIQERNKRHVVGGNLIDNSGRPVYEGPRKMDVINGVAVDLYKTPAGSVLPQDPNKPFGLGPDLKPVANTPFQEYDLRKSATGAARTNVTNINPAPRAFDIEMAKADAEKLVEFRKNAEAGQGMLSTVENLRSAIKSGVFSGGLANQKTAAANLINGITGVTPKNLPGSQLFDAEASKLVLDSIKLLGANPSNADRDFIAKTVPQLATSPQARDQLINFLEEKARKNIDLFQRADTYARQNRSLSGFNYLGGSQPSGTTTPPPNGVDPRVWAVMTPEERALWR